ncbi:hypothetical protein ACFLTX_01495 [Chloroflexota bacterium]
MSTNTDKNTSLGFNVKLVLLAWLSMIGFDFFLHAGILAPLYSLESPFLLPLEQAFALIPVGYLSFLGLAILLVWLMIRQNIRGWKKGAIFGILLGLLAWGSLILGLYSIATASPALLLGWFLGQTAELGIAGAVAGFGLEKEKLGRLFWIVLIFSITAMLAGIIWQNVANAY